MHRRTRLVLAGLGAAILTVTLPAGPAAAGRQQNSSPPSGPTVVVKGLNNPRQIAVDDLGGLLVAEAGSGGTTCVPVPGGETASETCIGFTGSISWVPLPAIQKNSSPLRVVTGLMSGANRIGASATGSQAVAADNVLDIFIGIVDEPRAELPDTLDKSTYGTMLRSQWLGRPRIVADVSAYEYAHDPDGQLPESNPYALLHLPGKTLIADAAANDILQWKNGRLSVFTVLPNIQDGICAGRPNDNGTTGCDPVPTGLALDRHGFLYVSALSNLSPNTGRVYKLNSKTGAIVATYPNLTGVTGVAVDRAGNVYASQVFLSKVTKIAPGGERTDISVPFPAGLAVVGNHLYVSAYSTAPAGGLGLPGVDSSGQIWRYRI